MFIKKFLTLLIFLYLLMPATHSFAQFSEEKTEMSEDSETTELFQDSDKDTAKKKKKKDLIELNEKFWVGLALNIITILMIIFLIYYPSNKKTDYIFTFILFNIVIFLLTFVLNKVKISMGAAFGLFAVFSMLRYRTEGISMKDMTYLFIFIALGLISAIRLEHYELAIINGIILITTFILDSKYIIKKVYSKRILYENIEMIKPENHDKLMQDLSARTGLNIYRIEITKINFLRDTAIITVFYK